MKISNNKPFNPSDVVSGLQYLLEESKVAQAKIDYSYAMERLQRRVTGLEEEIDQLRTFIKTRLK